MSWIFSLFHFKSTPPPSVPRRSSFSFCVMIFYVLIYCVLLWKSLSAQLTLNQKGIYLQYSIGSDLYKSKDFVYKWGTNRVCNDEPSGGSDMMWRPIYSVDIRSFIFWVLKYIMYYHYQMTAARSFVIFFSYYKISLIKSKFK